MFDRNNNLHLSLLGAAIILVAGSFYFKPSPQITQEAPPPSYEYNLKIQNQTIKGYRSPAAGSKDFKFIKDGQRTASSHSTQNDSFKKQTQSYGSGPSSKIKIEPAQGYSPMPSIGMSNGPSNGPHQGQGYSSAGNSSASTQGQGAQGSTPTLYSGSAPYPVQPGTDSEGDKTPDQNTRTESNAELIPVIKGKVKPLNGLITHYTSDLFISSAYANTCTDPRILLMDLTSMSILLDNPITEAVIDENTSFDFDPVELNLDLKSPQRYMLQTTGCTTNYQRIISSYYQDQDLDQATTLVSKIINTRIAGALSTTTAKDIQKLYEMIQQSAVAADSFEQVYQVINQETPLKSNFQSTFQGGAPEELTVAAPDIYGLTFKSQLKEKESHFYEINASQWNSQYTIGYEWQVDGEVFATTPQWTYVPSANSRPTQIITLVIGQKNSTDDLVDRNTPYHEIDFEVSVEDTYQALAPTLTLNSLSKNPSPTKSIFLDIATGSLVDSVYSGCETFSDLALTEGDAAPMDDQFNLKCETASSQKIQHNIQTASDGPITLKLWARDAADRISLLASTYSIEIDTSNPVIEFINMDPAYIAEQAAQFEWKMTERSSEATQFFNLEFYNGTSWSSLPPVPVTAGPHVDTVFTTTVGLPNINVNNAKLRLTYEDIFGHETIIESPVFEIQRPMLSSVPSSLDMGQVKNKADSAEFTFEFINTGAVSSKTCGPVTLTGAHAAEFQIVRDDCNGTTIGVTGCVVGVKAKPTSKGTRTASIVLTCENDNSSTPVSILSTNNAPLAANITKTTLEDNLVSISFGPITDVDGDNLNYSFSNGPNSGALSGCQVLAGEYVCNYTPNLNYNGDEVFNFKANDGTVDSNTGTVTVTVLPVNDVPTLTATQSVTTPEDTVLTFNLNPGFDVEGSPLSYIIVAQPSTGTLSCVGGTNNSCTYTPDLNFNGSTTFTYKVNDGTLDSTLATVTVNVSSENDPPVMGSDQTFATNEDTALALTLNAATDVDLPAQTLSYKLITQPTKGTLSGCIDNLTYTTGRNCTYTPFADVNGTDTFTFRSNDGLTDSTEVETVTINIAPINDAPTLTATQNVSTTEDTPLTFDLNAGTDIEGNTLSYVKLTNPANGTLTCAGGTNRSCTFTPNANWNGTTSFTYKVNDGGLDSTTATVTITVTPVNDPPVMAANQSYSVNDNTNLAITLSPATDIDGGTLSYKIITPPSNGTLSACITTGAYGTDLSCNYISNTNYNGTDSFTFIAYDTFTEALTPATVTITVSDKTPPTAPILITRTSPEYTKVTGVTFTAGTCTDQVMLLVNSGTQPTSGDGGWQTCTTAANAITHTLTAVGGPHTLKVWAKDFYGNVSTTSTDFVVYYDVTLPTMSLTLPPTLQGGSTYNLAWTATEAYTTTSLNFTIEAYNGTAWSTVGTTASTAGPLSNTAFTRSWTVPLVTTAAAQFRVSFTDRAGNSRTVTSGTFAVDSTPPALTITSPAVGSYHKGSATITGSCETGRDINFSGDIQANFTISCTTGTFTQLVNFSNGDGNKTITLTQTDAVGNITTVSRNLIRDEVSPVITKTIGASPDFTKLNVPNAWGGTCEGNYTISVTGSETTSFACSSGSWSWTPSPKTVDGTFSYNLVQTDAAGNVSSPPLTLSWTRDATAPLFKTTAPSVATAPATLNITNNLSSLSFTGSCEGTNPIAITGAATATFSCSSASWSWSTPTVSADGVRTYTFKQTDPAGNISTITVNWTRDTTGPALTIANVWSKTNTNTTTFSGDCEAGLTVNITGAQTTSTTCAAGTWSFTTAAQTTDAKRTFTFTQTRTVSPFNATSVTGYWVRKTTAPTISAFTTTAPYPSRSSFIPVSLDAASGNADVFLTHLCIKSDDNVKPTAADSCFLEVNSPAIGLALAPTIDLNNHSVLMGWTPKAYLLYTWVLDEAGNISNLGTSGAGTINIDKISAAYDPGIPPTVWDVIAANVPNSPLPPTRAQGEVPAGTDVYIRWKATDNVALPSGSVSLSYTPDEINFTEIVAGLNVANNGCGAITLAANEGCYKWTGGSPLNTSYKIRVKVTDAGDVSSQLISNPTNMGLIKIIAGNTESGLGGSAQTAMFYTRRNGSSDPGTLVVTNDGQFYFADYKRGILTIDQADGKQKIFIPTTGASTGDGGAAVNATLKFPVKLALDYQNRLLILDRDRIRRVDLNLSTPTIETIIGGGTDTSDVVNDPLNLAMYAHSYGAWDQNGQAFFTTPNGDIYFHSEYALMNPSHGFYRLRIFKAATGQVISKYFTGTGDAYVPTQDLLKCRMFNPAIAFDPNTSQLTGVSLTTYHTLSYTGCDQLEDRYSRAYFDPNTFVAIAPKDDSYRYAHYIATTGMDGNSYIIVYRSYIMRINFDGTYTKVLGHGTQGECPDGTDALSCMVDVQNLHVSSTGKMYFTDRGMIRTIDSEGKVKTLFGQKLTYGDGVNALNARFSEIHRVLRRDSGQIIVNDIGGNYIKEFSIEGNINIIAGDGAYKTQDTVSNANAQSVDDSSWFSINKSNGDVYASYASGSRGNVAKLNRATGKWEHVVGLSTGTHYASADGMAGANVRSNNSYFDRALVVGFDNNNLVLTRMRHYTAINRYEDFMIKLYDATDVFRQSHLAGIVGYPTDGNIRRTCVEASTGTTAATCEMPYWDTFFQFQWDAVNARWITAIVNGGTQKDIYEFKAGQIKKIGSTSNNIDDSFTYANIDGTQYFFYCNSGRIRKYNLTTQTDEGQLAWSMSNLYCRGRSMDFNPTNRSIIFPFEQNGLYGVGEYFIP